MGSAVGIARVSRTIPKSAERPAKARSRKRCFVDQADGRVASSMEKLAAWCGVCDFVEEKSGRLFQVTNGPSKTQLPDSAGRCPECLSRCLGFCAWKR